MATKTETLESLYEQRDITLNALNDIKKNKASSFRKGSMYVDSIKIRDLRLELNEIESKIATWENSPL
jgi:hypothetical protein